MKWLEIFRRTWHNPNQPSTGEEVLRVKKPWEKEKWFLQPPLPYEAWRVSAIALKHRILESDGVFQISEEEHMTCNYNYRRVVRDWKLWGPTSGIPEFYFSEDPLKRVYTITMDGTTPEVLKDYRDLIARMNTEPPETR